MAGREVTYLPADPPRDGLFAIYDAGTKGVRADDLDTELEVVVGTANGARRHKVPARLISVADAILALRDMPAKSATQSALAWSQVVLSGLVIVSRGRLYPAVTPAGWDAWRAGPLDGEDRRFLRELCAAFPPAAHAIAVEGRSPLRLPTPERLVPAAWDAIADVMPRTAAAAAVAGSPLYAAVPPQPAEQLRPWLADAARGLDGGATVALRIELGAGDASQDGDGTHADGSAQGGGREGTSEGDAAARAVLEVTSPVDPSLVVSGSELFAGPTAVVARFGPDAETDLLLALRRGSRAWSPLGELLRQRVPVSLDLGEDELADLLGDATAELAAAGIEVRWPRDLVTGGLSLRASVFEQPGKVSDAGFRLDQLVEFHWQATLDGEALSAEEIDQLAEAKRTLVRLRGRWVTIDPRLIARLREQRARRLSAAEALGALLGGTVDLDGEAVPVVAEGRLGELAARLGSLRGDGTAGSENVMSAGLEARVEGLDGELRPYQGRGVAWLLAMTDAGIGGCLADDMGLGKTLQVIALHLVRRAGGAGPTLVVCPTTLLANWEREVRRFAPGVPVRRYHGSGRELGEIGAGEIVVTSYGVARRDHKSLGDAGFSLVVADEAQHAKNPASATARALRAVPAQARVALTGTPVENRLSELWSILDWTTPGLLGPLERFSRNVATPVERYRDPVATERLSRMVRPFVLRRRKADPGIAPDLPPRTVHDIPVPLTAEQVTLYEAEVRVAMEKIREKEGFERQGLVLHMLMALKQICNHPAQYLHQKGPLPKRSGKFAALEELLGVILDEGESTLVFSQFVELLSLVEARFGELGIPTLFLHGSVPAKRRTEMVDAFQAGKVPVFLLSLKAGGVGLNLTRATHVIHVDRWWNPAVEDQATDRAHRIGQDRPVEVHRLVAEGTLEDRIAELIEKKRDLAESVVGGGEAWLSSLSDEDLAGLVELGRP